MEKKYMDVPTIAARTSVNRHIVYQFVSKHKIPRTKRQGQRYKMIDVSAYITALREDGFDYEAELLEKGESPKD
jgi:predicted DNA-binding transcriptional regulator AlpA